LGILVDITERKRAEEDLKKSRERFQLVTRATNDALWEWDAVTGEGWWSEGVQTLFGYSAEEVRTDSEWWRERVHPEDVERIESGILAVIKGNGHHWSDEYRFRRADGSYAHVLDRAHVARDAAGKAIRVMGAIIDITGRKRSDTALRASERRYRTLVEEMNEGLIVTDLREVIEFVNDRICALLGYPREEMVGRTTFEFMARAEDREIVVSKAQLREQGISDRYELAFRRRSGETVWTLVSGTPLVDAGGAVAGTIGIVTDITERKRTEDALRQSEERYALAAAGANDGLWDWDLTKNEVYYSSRWKAMLGYDDAAIGNSPEEWFGRVHHDDLEWLKVTLDGHLAGATAHFEAAHRIRHRDGTLRWMLTRGLAVRDATGRAYRVAGSQTDITERKVTEQQLMHDAFHDALTGLPNRALFMDELVHSVHRAKRRKDYAFAVLYLDVDRFKLVNDSLGHGAGDQMLVALARRLQEAVRPGDRVARLGGDEFAVLLDDVTDGSDATRVAGRIQEALEAPLDLAGREVFSTASIGIALSLTGYDRAEDALRDADLASYRAKAQGRDRCEVFDLGMHARAVARLELETDLRRALERREFGLDYQPIVALESGDIVGFEALLRWRHPHRGLLGPGEFVPVAEDTGLIVPIGRWVLREACRQLCEWRRAFPDRSTLGISVNVSFKQLLRVDLPQHVEQVLAEAELQARRLHLEVTENVIMEHAEAVASVLARLKDLNVRLHMDDFGTGYSSLSNLRRFPVDALKIDRLFVSRMEEAENLEIVRTIIALAHHLGLRVIAEGVETGTQAAQLRALECEYGQGFLYSRPVSAEAAAALLANRSALAP
ncbi:MAG: EAL domain-containing protein, partial [Gemmatimonadetes bacterium]|nr:EAL domain-containing protein [Gemmatimonadota bacterium]